MNFVSHIAFGVAVILVAAAGVAAMLQADRIRDALARLATAAAVVGLAVPMLAGVLRGAGCRAPRLATELDVHPLFVVAVVVGHMALGVFLLWRRAGVERTGFVADVEAARGRERVRLTPPIAREDVR